jgi:hypothetical protein
MESKVAEIESVTELLEFFKKDFEKADESVYPIAGLTTSVRMLKLAVDTDGMEDYLESDTVKDLIKLVERRITPPDVLTLLARGYGEEEFGQIQLYTDNFAEIKRKISRQSSLGSTSCSSDGSAPSSP